MIHGMNNWLWESANLSDVKRAGVTIVRQNLYVNDPDVFQAQSDSYHAAGLKVLPVLSWTDAGKPVAPPSDKEWRQAVNEAVKRFPESAYEVWNEPNLSFFWPGSPADFADIVTQAHSEIKAVNPQITVISAGLAANEHHDWQDYLSSLIKAGMKSDAIAIHPYEANSVMVLRDVHWTQDMTRLPVWVTEFGWSTGGPRAVAESRQQQLLAMTYAKLKTAKTAAAFWFCWQDDPALDSKDAYARAGLLRPDGSYKPAHGMFRYVTKHY